ITAQDTGIALRELRVALNMLDLLAYTRRATPAAQVLLRQVIDEVSGYFKHCSKAGERLPAPRGLLMAMDRARRALTDQEMGYNPARLHLLHALSGLRLALLPGVEIVTVGGELTEQLPHNIDGAPL
ncbi:fusaric acid resistance protein, partial [Pseudomonas syringae pv. actinidiae]